MSDNNIDLKSAKIELHTLIPPVTSYVLLDKIHNLSETQFPYLKMGTITFI